MGGQALRSPPASAAASAIAAAAAPTKTGGGGKHKKAAIPKALREQVWLSYGGPEFDKKCAVTWCTNRITAFSFHVGHVIAESKGGPTVLENLLPLCANCNLSMGTKSIDEWSKSVVRKDDVLETKHTTRTPTPAHTKPHPAVQSVPSTRQTGCGICRWT